MEQLAITITAIDRENLVKALQEVLELIEAGVTSGTNFNEDGGHTLWFIRTEEKEVQEHTNGKH